MKHSLTLYCCIQYSYFFFFLFYFLPELRSDSEKKSQMESLQSEISSLKEQIVQQQQALQLKTAQVGKPDCCDRAETISQLTDQSIDCKFIGYCFESDKNVIYDRKLHIFGLLLAENKTFEYIILGFGK